MKIKGPGARAVRPVCRTDIRDRICLAHPIALWAVREGETGRWAVDWPPTMFSERREDALLHRRPPFEGQWRVVSVCEEELPDRDVFDPSRPIPRYGKVNLLLHLFYAEEWPDEEVE